MRKMTEDNLKSAFAGESQAHMRYLIFSDAARQEGRENLSRLFEAIAYAERVHATNHLKALAGIGNCADNLEVAIDGETYEVEEMYPAFLAVAELQGAKGARKSNKYALEAEKVHAAMYQEAKQAILDGKDITIGPIYICPECGYTVEREAPERCPICGAKQDRFRGFWEGEGTGRRRQEKARKGGDPGMWQKAAVVAFLALGMAVWSGGFAQAIVLSEGGQPSSTIILPPDASEKEKEAGKELRTYLLKMSGATLPIAPSPPRGPSLLIGRAGAPLTPETFSALGRDGFILKTVGESLAIRGATDNGTLYGAYALLERLGVRWYMPGELGEEVPKREAIEIADLDVVSVPDFEFRSVGGGDWAIRNGLGGVSLNIGQWWYLLIPPNTHFPKHPEYFALVGGKRQPSQLCTSNPDVVRLATESALGYFRANRDNEDIAMFSLSPNDNADFCECHRCLIFGPLIDRLLVFWNRVAEEVAKEFPERRIASLAFYPPYVQLPTIRPHPNFLPVLCRFGAWQAYERGITADEVAASELRRIFEWWNERSPVVYTYDYWGHYAWYAPFPIVHTLRKDISYYKSMGIDGVCRETHTHWATQGLNFYVAAKLLWDVDTDVDALLEDYFEGMYHGAAKPMREYFDLLEERAAQSNFGGGDPAVMPNFFTEELLGQLDQKLRLAEELADTEKALTRVGLAKVGQQYTKDYVTARRLLASAFANHDKSAVRQALALLEDAIQIVKASDALGAFETEMVLGQLEATAAPLKAPLKPFPIGPFSYSDGYNDSCGKLLMDSLWYRGFYAGSYGPYLSPGASGALGYEFTAEPGAIFETATLNLISSAPYYAINVSADGGRTYRTVATEVKRGQPIDLSFIKGSTSFRLEFLANNPSDVDVIALDQSYISGSVVAARP